MGIDRESSADYLRKEFGHGNPSFYSEMYHLASTLQSVLILNSLNMSRPMEKRKTIDWNSARDGFIANLMHIKSTFAEEIALYSENIEDLSKLANQEWNEQIVKQMDAILNLIILKVQGTLRSNP